MVSYGRCVNNCPISVCVGILSSSDGSLYYADRAMDIGGGFVCGGFNLAVVLYLLCMFLRVGILLVVLSIPYMTWLWSKSLVRGLFCSFLRDTCCGWVILIG